MSSRVYGDVAASRQRASAHSPLHSRAKPRETVHSGVSAGLSDHADVVGADALPVQMKLTDNTAPLGLIGNDPSCDRCRHKALIGRGYPAGVLYRIKPRYDTAISISGGDKKSCMTHLMLSKNPQQVSIHGTADDPPSTPLTSWCVRRDRSLIFCYSIQV